MLKELHLFWKTVFRSTVFLQFISIVKHVLLFHLNFLDSSPTLSNPDAETGVSKITSPSKSLMSPANKVFAVTSVEGAAPIMKKGI